MKEENSKILEVKNLRISFKTINGTVKAVRGIDFSLYRGRTLAIVGESGSGKSVTSRAIMGLLAPNKIVEEGEILYGDQDLLRLSEDDYCKIRCSKISMIFQDPLSSLNPIKKVGKQITESMKIKRKSAKKEDKAFAKAAYAAFSAYLERHPEEAGAKKALDDFCAMYRNPNDQDYRFRLAKFDRISKDKEKAYQKGIVSQNNEEQRKALIAQKDAYLAKRAEMRKKLEQELQDFDAKIKAEGKDYEAYDPSPLFPLAESLIREDLAALAERMAKNGPRFAKKCEELLSLEGEEFTRALAKALPELNELILSFRDPLALEKDEALSTFFVSFKHRLEEYSQALKREKKQEKEKRKHGGETPEKSAKERAWASEIDTSSASFLSRMKEELSQTSSSLLQDYPQELEGKRKEEAIKESAKRYVLAFKDAVVGASRKIRNEELVERAINLLGEVGISEPEKRIKQYPFEFSGGMRQRIVIAIALSSNPEILICDEPTTALDVTIQAQILELINGLKKKRNLSIIFITHNLGVVANMADDIAVMYAGKIVEYGTVDEIFYEPKHPYTWALLSSMPDLETKNRLEAIPGTPPNMIIPPKGDAFAPRNKYAMKIDFEQAPPPFYVSPTHWAATWLLAEGAPHVEPPKIVTERIARMKARQLSSKQQGKEAGRHE